MVKRYSAYANNTHAYEDVDGVFVKYEDYAELETLIEWLCFNIKLHDLPPSKKRDKLEEWGFL